MPASLPARGCQACKRQKKKCDQLKPSCSRCARLQIQCTGVGQQSYRFKDQTLVLQAKQAQRAPGTVSGKPEEISNSLCRLPCSETAVLTCAFMTTLNVRDLRYDVHVYGEFLEEIPRRLGTNDALDASVDALNHAYPCLYSRKTSVQALSKYIQGIKTLRVAMEEPSTVRHPSTLCAIYLMMITQAWIGRRDDQKSSHSEALAHLLTAVYDEEQQQDDFQGSMLITLCFAVIFESIANPKIHLPSCLWTLARQPCGPPSPGTDLAHSLSLPKLCRIPLFVRQSELHFAEIQSAYRQMRTELEDLQRTIAISADRNPPQGPFPTMTTHVKLQIAYAILLCLAVLLNGVLQALTPNNTTLADEYGLFFDETLRRADAMSCYRPLGSGYMSVLLMAIWCTAATDTQRAQVESRIDGYSISVEGISYIENLQWLRRRLANLRLKYSTRRDCDAAIGDSASGIRLNGAKPEPIKDGDTCYTQ